MNAQVLLRDENFVRDLSRHLTQPLLFNRFTRDREGGQSGNNIVGFGVGYKQRDGLTTDELCIIVYVKEKLPLKVLPKEEQIRAQLQIDPDDLGLIDEKAVYRSDPEYRGIDPPGIPTDIQVIGTPRFDSGGTYTGYTRPLRPGISVGWRQDTTGTLGCFVRDKKLHKICVLTAAHVLGQFNQGGAGDIVIQPGGDDEGKVLFTDPQGVRPQDYYHIAKFVRTAPVTISQTPQKDNTVDAAIAELMLQHDYRSRIEGDIGTPVGEGKPEEGMIVHKAGRTTGYTIGKITSKNSTFRMKVGGTDVPFTDLITTTVMTKPGDSGSLLLSAERNKALGILMGSSDNRSFFCKFSNIKPALDIELP
jgi:hypothetical protein